MADRALERRALTLFEAMLDIDEDERETWLKTQLGDDPELLERVSAIWQADKMASLRTGGASEEIEELETPERIGSYRISGIIGSGGMGTVYAADRDTGDFDHSVAIKLIKPGILSSHLIDRFNSERQILANLNHPHIARLFDGGTTPDGQPFIVMERIDGRSLLAWIGEENPPLRERLRLFLQICEAAAYAHRNLIVHRDLTPANVLVDSDGDARLIDFGIARPDDAEAALGDRSDRQAPLRAITMTPGYAAPERAAGQAATVLSDIYSSGKMLADIVALPRPDDISAIIAKATAAEPGERYLSMDRIADDIRAFLQDRPVSAVEGTTGYRFGKWVRRNRPLAALGSALLVALVAGSVATGWWWREAVVARDQADARFDEVRGIANFMLFELYDELEPVSGNTKALSQIADESRAYLERLSASEDLSDDLRLEIARGYHRLSTVSGNPEGANLGRREDAKLFLDRALRDLEALYARNSAEPKYTLALADALYSQAIFKFIAEDDNSGSIAPADRSAQLYKGLMDAHPKEISYRLDWYRSRLQAAKPFVWIDKGDEGVSRLEALVAEIEQDEFLEADSPEARIALASANSELGYTRSWHIPVESAQYRQALPPLDRAVGIYDDLYRNGPRELRDERRLTLIASLFRRSLVHYDLKQLNKSLADLERAEKMATFLINRDADDEGAKARLDTLHSQKIYVLLDLDRASQAIPLAERLLSRRLDRLEREPADIGRFREVVTARQTLAEALERNGDAKACAEYRKVEKGWDDLARKSEISSVDRGNSIEPLQEALARCAR